MCAPGLPTSPLVPPTLSETQAEPDAPSIPWPRHSQRSAASQWLKSVIPALALAFDDVTLFALPLAVEHLDLVMPTLYAANTQGKYRFDTDIMRNSGRSNAQVYNQEGP